jgi:hypothetical protein
MVSWERSESPARTTGVGGVAGSPEALFVPIKAVFFEVSVGGFVDGLAVFVLRLFIEAGQVGFTLIRWRGQLRGEVATVAAADFVTVVQVCLLRVAAETARYRDMHAALGGSFRHLHESVCGLPLHSSGPSAQPPSASIERAAASKWILVSLVRREHMSPVTAGSMPPAAGHSTRAKLPRHGIPRA